MFYDMALLVDEQGEMIDHIEHNVENAAVHVEIGRTEVRVAVQFQRKNRKVSRLLYCCCCYFQVRAHVAVVDIVRVQWQCLKCKTN